MTTTEPQATALANLLHELRPDWPVKSLLTLIGKHRDSDFPALCTVAVTVAADTRNQTPAVIFLELDRRAASKLSGGPWTKEFHQQRPDHSARGLAKGLAMLADYEAKQSGPEAAASAVVPAGYRWANR